MKKKKERGCESQGKKSRALADGWRGRTSSGGEIIGTLKVQVFGGICAPALKYFCSS